MDRILRPNLTQINNVAIGQTFSCEFPIGPAYRYIDLVLTMTSASAKTTAAITDFFDLITLFANGKPFRTFLATEGNDIWTRYGSNYKALICQSSGSANTLIPVLSSGAPAAPAANSQTTCKLRIYFEEPWRKNWAAASSRKFYTSWPAKVAGGSSQVLTNFSITGIIPSTTNNAGATGVALQIYAGTDATQGPLDANKNPITNTLKWQRYPGLTYTAAGDLQVNNIVKYDKGKQLAIIEEVDIFSQSSGDDVNRVQVFADTRTIMDVTSIENYDELVRHGFNPTAWNLDEFAIVHDANDVITDGLFLSTPTGQYVNNYTLTCTMSQASGSNKTLVFIAQLYAPLD